MKRLIISVIISFPLLLSFSVTSYSEVLYNYVEEQMEQFNTQQIYDALSDETKKMMENIGIDGIDSDSILNVSERSVFDLLFSLLRDDLKTPIAVMGTVVGIMLLAALMNGFSSNLLDNSHSKIYEFITAFAAGITIILPLKSCLSDALNALELSSEFMTAFIPVFVTVIIATGKPLTALSFNSLVFSLAEIITRIMKTVIIPLITCFLSLSLVGSFSSEIKINGVISFAKKCVTVIMGFMSTVFVSLICMKSFVSSASDTVGTKASKFILGSFLPVVGSSMGEAMSTVKQCLNLVKSTAGAFGIAGILLIFIPIILSILSWQISLFVSISAGEILGLGDTVNVIKSISSTLSLLLAALVFSVFLLVISITVMLLVRGE